MTRCSACRGENARYSLDGTRIRLCAACIGSLVALAGDLLTMARRFPR